MQKEGVGWRKSARRERVSSVLGKGNWRRVLFLRVLGQFNLVGDGAGLSKGDSREAAIL